MSPSDTTRRYLTWLAVLVVLLAALISSASFAYAQTPASAPQPTLVARVNIYNAAITKQDGDVFSISFKLSNREGAQPNIRYAVELVDSQQNVVDEVVYPETLNLASNTEVQKDITYTAPAYLSGTYQLVLISQNTSGLPLAEATLGPVTLSGKGQYAQIEPSTCFLQVRGTTEKFTIDQGIDIKPTETLDLTCALRNNSQSDLSLTPSFKTFARDVFGAQVETPAQQLQPVIVKSGGATTFTLPLPKPSWPQAYDTTLSFSDASGIPANSIMAHFVIDGASATIQNLILDKTAYQVGDIAQVFIYWTGPADSFIDARATSTVVSGVQATLHIADPSGDSCGADVTTAVDPLKPTQTVPFPISRTCVSPVVSASLADRSGVPLASSIFAFTGTSTPAQAGGGHGGEYAAVVLAMLLIAAYLWWFVRHPRTPASTAAFVLVIICAAYACNPAQARADTFSEQAYLVTATGWTGWDTATYTVNLNNNVYPPGGTITASGHVTDSVCGNSIYGGIKATINNVSENVLVIGITGYTSSYPYDPIFKVYQSSQAFTAETTAGNYYAHFHAQLYAVTGGTPSDQFCLPAGLPNTTGNNSTCVDYNGPSTYGSPGQMVTNSMNSYTWMTPYNIPYSVVAPLNCTFNGNTVLNGASVTAYQASTVPYGSSCVSQPRTCSNGTLSGSYAYSSCTVQPQPAPTCSVTFNPSTINQGQSSTMSWSSTNITGSNTFYINNVGYVGASGSASVAPSVTTNYTGTVTNSSGTATCPASLTVNCTPSGTNSCSDSTHVVDSCGTAVQTCTGGLTCSSGVCAASCTPNGTLSCSGTNVVDSCGTVKQNCSPTTQTCSSGSCVNCPAGQFWNGTSCQASCTDSYSCQGSDLYHQDTSCTNTKVQTCSYGCSGGLCLPPPTPTINFSVTPLLVRKGETVQVAWSTTNISACTVSGSNSDLWSGTSGTDTSLAIQSQTIYTIRCTSSVDGSTVSQSATVNIIPVWCEPGAAGC